MLTFMFWTGMVWAQEPTNTTQAIVSPSLESEEEQASDTPKEPSSKNSDNSKEKDPKEKKEKKEKEKKEKKEQKTKAKKEQNNKTNTQSVPKSGNPSSNSSVKAKKGDKASLNNETFRPHLIVGIETGAALSTTDIRVSFLPQWQFGVQLPYWNDRLGIVFQGVYHVSKMDGSAQDDNMTSGSYTYSIRQQEGEVGMNLRVRIPEVPVVTPELWLGPTVQMLQTTLDGKSGSPLPTSVEQDTRIGLHAALLGEYTLPVGSLIGGVHYTTYQFASAIQGDVRNHTISPTVGYRYRFF